MQLTMEHLGGKRSPWRAVGANKGKPEHKEREETSSVVELP